MKAHYHYAATLCLALTLALMACSSPSTPQPAAPAATSKPAAAEAPKATEPAKAPAAPATAAAAPAAQVQRGGVLRMTLGSEPGDLDPHRTSTAMDRIVDLQVYEGLVELDEKNDPQPALATKWEQPDPKTYLFTLREGVKFHNGKALTAEDVVFTFQRAANKDIARPMTLNRVLDVATVEATGPMTVKVVLKRINTDFLSQIDLLWIVPKDFDPKTNVGTGPFTFGEWVRNERITLNKFAGYWKQGSDGKALPYLDGVTFLPTPDENTKITRLQGGQVDVTDTVPLPRVAELLKDARFAVQQPPAGTYTSSYYVLPNLSHPPLDKVEVRQAISYAIDRKALNDAVFGFGDIRSNPIPEKMWGFSPTAPSYNQRNVAKAKELMAKAGVASAKIKLNFTTSRAEFATMAQVIQANLAEIGITVELIPTELAAQSDITLKRDFDLSMSGTVPDPTAYLCLDTCFAGSQAVRSGYASPEFAKAMEAAVGASTREEARLQLAKAQEIGMTDQPEIITNERPVLVATTKKVHGVAIVAGGLMQLRDGWKEQ